MTDRAQVLTAALIRHDPVAAALHDQPHDLSDLDEGPLLEALRRLAGARAVWPNNEKLHGAALGAYALAVLKVGRDRATADLTTATEAGNRMAAWLRDPTGEAPRDQISPLVILAAAARQLRAEAAQ